MLTKYLVGQIGRPFLAALGIASALFSSYGAANFLQQAANGLLSSHLIVYMIFFKLLIALEIIVPVALFLGIIMAFGKMYENAEFQAVPALRFGPSQILRALLTVAIPVALLVAFLSLVVRPWAFENLYRIDRNAAVNVDLMSLLPNVFCNLNSGKRIVYISRKPNSGAQNIFIFENHEPQYLKILTARQGYVLGNVPDDENDGKSSSWVHFRDGEIFELGLMPNVSDKIIQIQQANQNPTAQPLDVNDSIHSSSVPTVKLWKSTDSGSRGELEWRFVTGLSTLLLALLALPLAKTAPRQGSSGRIGIAIAIYFVYYVTMTVARNWVRADHVPVWLGLWWAPALLGTLTVCLLWRYFTDGFVPFWPYVWHRLRGASVK